MEEIFITSSLDKTEQPSLFLRASEPKRPLLVGLHTWSFDRFNQVDVLVPLAKKLDFNLILPEFRGPNLKSNPRATEACGSDLAIGDIKDAVEYAVEKLSCDADNIFLYGQSGGGYMALLVAAHYPTLFRAVCAFVPICDLLKWSEQNPNYGVHVGACCNNDPSEMKRRSPVSYLGGLARSNTKIFHGKYDTCVPFTQSMDLYTSLTAQYPTSRVFLDVFDGAHQFDLYLAEHWIRTQYKPCALDEVSG